MLKHSRASAGWNDKNIGQKGFTLIELLVVIIILGILAAVVVLAVNGLQNRGTLNACKTEKKTVEAAAAAYYADQDPNAWPASDTVLETGGYMRNSKYTWSIATSGSGAGTATGSGTGFPSGC